MMFEQYKDKFMIWQLHNRKEIVCFVAGFIVGVNINMKKKIPAGKAGE